MPVPTKSTSVIPAIKAKSGNVRASDSSRPSDSNLNGGISAIVMMVKAFPKIAEKLSSGLPKQLHKAKLVRDGVWVDYMSRDKVANRIWHRPKNTIEKSAMPGTKTVVMITND